MSKKSMLIAGAVALVVIALGVGLYARSRQSVPSIKTNAGSESDTSTVSSDQSLTVAGTASGGTGSGGTGSGGTASGGTGSGGTGSGGTASGGTGSDLPPLQPFPRMDEPTIPAETLSSPSAPGKTLPPLTAAPDPTLVALKLAAVPDGSQYTITMRPYGFGPSSLWGSGIAIRVDSAKPIGKAPANSDIANANLLVLVDTNNGGAVTQGGTYTAKLTLRSDGTKLLPIMSEAKATN
jgi:hypothetical protein